METIIKPFQIAIASRLIREYKGDVPFSTYFSAQARLNKNWGSRDRKIYRQACYAYFRLGYAAQEGSIESNILLAMQPADAIIDQLEPGSIYPYPENISPKISFNDWVTHLLYQKPVYLRMVKGSEEKIFNYLNENNLSFEKMDEGCIKLEAGTSCEAITDKGWAWIMDISSQRAAAEIKISDKDKVWDCCSGAGGKALYLTNSKTSDFSLTCSDARFSVLDNLKQRFNTCRLHLPRIELCDLHQPFQLDDRYDVIVADVPCSGSGTWGRNPENITFTENSKISFYAKLQRTIIDNARKNLRSGGRLYYITCSVFKEENDQNVEYFTQRSGMQLIREAYIHANGVESDWLYLAEMEKQ